MFGMISTQGYKCLPRERASHPCFRSISLPPDAEEWLINRAESSEWTVIRECLIASVAERFEARERQRGAAAPENIIETVRYRDVLNGPKYTKLRGID